MKRASDALGRAGLSMGESSEIGSLHTLQGRVNFLGASQLQKASRGHFVVSI